MKGRNGHAKAAIRREVIRRTIAELRSADGVAAFRYGPNGERLTEYHFVPEQIGMIADALERALNGDPDPLQLRPRGRKPEYPLRRLEAAAAMATLLHREGRTVEEARAEAADALGVSVETIRDALADEVLGERAQMLVEAALFWATEEQRQAADIIREHCGRQ